MSHDGPADSRRQGYGGPPTLRAKAEAGHDDRRDGGGHDDRRDGGGTGHDRPSLGELAWVVFRDANRTLGGGLAAMELLRRTAIKRGWLDEADNSVLVAASRLTPGTNVLAYCVGFGWRLRGAAGAALAVVAASAPGAVVVAVLSATLVEIDRYRGVRMVLAAGTIVAAALVLSSTWPLVRPHLRRGSRVWAASIIGLAVALLLLGATPVQTLLAAAAVGAAIST